MLTSSSRAFSRVLDKRFIASQGRRWISTKALTSSRLGNKPMLLVLSGAVGMGLLTDIEPQYASMAAAIPSSGDALSIGTPVREEATKIWFPLQKTGLVLCGCGVRVKFIFVKVYAVGTYMDPVAMMAVKNGTTSDIEKALLDPKYPRTIRIVMNRGLSIEKYTAAIVEALEPRMKGEELDKLEEFKKLNPPVDLVEGAEIEMTIRGDTLLYKNAVGGVGSLKSQRFMEALCDVYYGEDPASPTHKENVLQGIRKL